MAKQSNFPDNVHVGSPEHDRMVCDITRSFVAFNIPFIKEFLTTTVVTTRLKLTLYWLSGEVNIWDHLQNHTIPPFIDPDNKLQRWIELQTDFDSIPTVPHNAIQIRYEVPVTNDSGRYKTIVGYWDAQVDLLSEEVHTNAFARYFKRGQHDRAFLEVKPKIESLGALLRQINLYKEYSSPGPIYVYTPDMRFTAQLQSQGVEVIEAQASALNGYEGGAR